MAGDIAAIAAEVTPAAAAALSAYGTAVLAKAKDDLADAKAGDAQLSADVREIIGATRPNVTVTQTISAGRDAYTAGQDMTITRNAKYAVDVSGGQGVQIGDGNVQRNDFGGK